MDKQLEHHPIHANQHGFRCTETAISKTTNKIEKQIAKNGYCIGLFIDIQAAFDTICPKYIKKFLLKHGDDKDMVD